MFQKNAYYFHVNCCKLVRAMKTRIFKKYSLHYLEQVVQAFLLAILIGSLCIFLSLFHQFGSTSKVINYAGIVRGCSQRIIKLEMAEENADDLIQYVDDIMDGLEEGGSRFHLTRLKDQAYQDSLASQNSQWQDIKAQITLLRSQNDDESRTTLLDMSEDYYQLCDTTVGLAQDYSQQLVHTLNCFEIISFLALAGMVIITLHRYWLAARAMRRSSAMEIQLYHDSLTGIYSRKYYESILRTKEQLPDSSVIYIDLDHLKYINDTYGHNAGDAYLKKAVNHLKSSFRTSDLIIRMGGDEFVAILLGCREDIAARIMEKTLSGFRQTNDTPYPCSFSYGISTVDKTRTLQDAIRQADEKMYAYKRDSRIIRGK